MTIEKEISFAKFYAGRKNMTIELEGRRFGRNIWLDRHIKTFLLCLSIIKLYRNTNTFTLLNFLTNFLQRRQKKIIGNFILLLIYGFEKKWQF